MSTSKPHILIVGAGAWGASTAVSLLKSGNYSVTLIDRASVLPAEDAASTDIKKIVRIDYEQDVYEDLAFEALGRWREREWCGTVVVSPLNDTTHDLEATISNAKRRGSVTRLSLSTVLQQAFDPFQYRRLGRHLKQARLCKSSRRMGGRCIGHRVPDQPDRRPWRNRHTRSGRQAKAFIMDTDDVPGVITTDGREFGADKTIASAGAWTDGLMHGLLPEDLIINSAITMAASKL